MPRKKSIDYEKLLNAVESGMSSKEIMAKFKINTSAQLKSYYLDALIQDGKVQGIAGRSSRGLGKKDKDILVNKRGSLVVPKEIVQEMGFKVEDVFHVRRTKSGISLRKL